MFRRSRSELDLLKGGGQGGQDDESQLYTTIGPDGKWNQFILFYETTILNSAKCSSVWGYKKYF